MGRVVWQGSDASAYLKIGGFCAYSDSDSVIRRCYSVGKVAVQDDVIRAGGFCGRCSEDKVEDCFWDVQTSGMDVGVGTSGTYDVVGLTTQYMKLKSTFVNAGWDFEGIDDNPALWQMPFKHYPRLGWEDAAQFAQVDLEELFMLASYWGMTGCTDSVPCGQVDWFVDEKIDLLDLEQLATSWLGDTVQTDSGLGDNFETGDFTVLPWLFDGQADWQIASDAAYQGSYSAKSGSISNNKTTAVFFETDTNGYSAIRFALKVSSESADKLTFYIDDQLQQSWSGETDWTEVTFNVSEGIHTFKWEYAKDYIVAKGSDCAWIDDIKIVTE
jgi:hypothetical protein